MQNFMILTTSPIKNSTYGVLSFHNSKSSRVRVVHISTKESFLMFLFLIKYIIHYKHSLIIYSQFYNFFGIRLVSQKNLQNQPYILNQILNISLKNE